MSCLKYKDAGTGCCNHLYHGSKDGVNGGYQAYKTWGKAILPHARWVRERQERQGFVFLVSIVAIHLNDDDEQSRCQAKLVVRAAAANDNVHQQGKIALA